ncbi:MAG: glycerol kinase GlpK [Cellvibrionaceae bacterium]
MTETPLLLAIDQGTTSSRAIVFNSRCEIVAQAQQEFPQIYPADGWVEHDPEAIWETTVAVIQQAVNEAERNGGKVVAAGITNQRETTLVWDRASGEPIYNAIVWQDRRTFDSCEALRKQQKEDWVRDKTGLLLDPYFSATKASWILDNVDGARAKAESGELAFGTVDSFLIWRLTGGKVHATDATNASRTNLYNIHDGQWDDELLDLFKVPASVLPRVQDCSSDFGAIDTAILGREIPILGVAGDQQAAAIGQGCFDEGSVKSTYGTGCFALLNIGEKPVLSNNRLLTTVAYQLDGKPTYALEGSIFIAGASIQWLRDGLKIIDNAAETESMARSLESNRGVYLVPAFTGLGAPYWRSDVRGAIFGITRDTGPAELARAALESVCYQTHDLLSAMAEDARLPARLRVDGGMVGNEWVMQLLADVLNVEVDRPVITETTALGVAYLAGLKVGIFESLDQIASQWRCDKSFSPKLPVQQRDQLLRGWTSSINKVLAD